mmetsp:Transcript_16660/g.29158  ORF Transcript_16660/g.29158 Transcript_16660/m.29158 type:complete len:262 (+) Transcript_16660:68-853(+)
MLASCRASSRILRCHGALQSSRFPAKPWSHRGLSSLSDFKDADADGDGKISLEEFQAWQRKQKPTIQVAQDMPREYWEMSNEVLLLMAARGNEGAQRERMVREVMSKTPCSWDEAQPIVEDIKKTALTGSGVFEVPYYTNLALGLLSGAICLPLIFHLPTVEWFNEKFVTSDEPPEKDLETSLEVSIWAWNWMEPLIGTASFVLLVCQFSRAQMLNIGLRPYGRRVFDLQVTRLQQKYPQFNGNIIEDFLVGALQKQSVMY